MASIQELFRTGFVLDKIFEPPEYPWENTQLMLRHRSDLDVRNILPADKAARTLVGDLQGYLRSRLYGLEISSTYSGLDTSGLMAWELFARKHNYWGRYEYKQVCAIITSGLEGRRVKIVLPGNADRFYPEVGVEPHLQRAGLLADYAQIFAFTERAIRTRRHIQSR